MNDFPNPDKALSIIADVCRRLDTEPARLDKARTRVLRETIVSPEDMPAFDSSAVDGFAIRLDDTSTVFSVVDEIRAGQWKPRQLAIGQAVRIFTGAPAPGEALQVVMQEDAAVNGGSIQILQRDSQRHIRFRGENAKKGLVLLQPPLVLDAGELALLASAGFAYPMVSRLPVIFHFATGDELVAPGEIPPPGGIRDSNSILIQSLLAGMGLSASQGHLPEDFQTSVTHLQTRDAADVLILSGGASVGRHDHTRRILEELGYRIHFHGLGIRPGKPLLFGSRGAAIAFGLPGNPLAHYVCFHLFVKPALRAMLGLAPSIPFHAGRLAAPLDGGESARETFWPADAVITGAGFELTPIAWQSSGDIIAMAKANALIRIPSGCALLNAGAPVSFLSTR